MTTVKHLSAVTLRNLINDLKAILEAQEPMAITRPEYVIDLSVENLDGEKPYDLIFNGVDHIELN